MNYFDKTTIRLLKQFYRELSINEFNIPKSQNESFHILLKQRFIRCANTPEGYDDLEPEDGLVYEITPHGKAYIQELGRDFRNRWIPITISLLALIGAYRQELTWLIQAVMKLLK